MANNKYFCFLILNLVYSTVLGSAVLKIDIDKIRGSRIVGGEDATIEEFPYIASLHFFHLHICGAVIVSERWLVTAAHCTTLDLGFHHTPILGLSVRIGSARLQADGQQISVLRVYDHPTFLFSAPVGLDYDISLLYLERDITFSSTVQPIRLPAPGEVYPAGTSATVIGWGVIVEFGISLAETLQKVQVPLITNETCETWLNLWFLYNFVTARMICAGFEEGGRDACGGDSGGPLSVNGTVVGIVSWGYGCAREFAPGVYTDVQVLREWIGTVSGL